MAAPAGIKAVALINGDNSSVRGSIQFIQDINGITHVRGKIAGLSPGRHGFHIHAFGDASNGCNSTGPHFNPLKKNHGAPSDQERHAGDLGNIVAGPDGIAEVSLMDMQIPLSGPHSILGRAIVVHADPDDLGRGGHELSKSTGNAGARVGCGEEFYRMTFLSWGHINCPNNFYRKMVGLQVPWLADHGTLFSLVSLGYNRQFNQFSLVSTTTKWLILRNILQIVSFHQSFPM